VTKPTRIVKSLLALLMAAGLSVPAAVLTPAVAGPVPIRLKVMTFNIQYGASYSTLDAVVKAIEAADADVVGIQEAFGKTRRIAKMLGWYASPSMHMVSRFPIVRPGGSTVPGSPGGRIPDGMVAYLLLAGGSVAAIAQTHTPWWPNGMSAMMQGAGPDEVVAKEQGKINWLAPHLEATAEPIADGLPVFFVGDLNSPSHLDWTPEAVDALGWQPPTLNPPGDRYPIAWPTTVTMEDAGFRDTYREMHPDPIADPGFTYCNDLYPACGPWDTWDRIDYVDAAGPSTTVRSRVVGEGGPYTDIVSRPWPTDHRAVVSVFDVTPVSPPSFAAPIDEVVTRGRAVHVAFHDPASTGRTVGLWARGADPGVDAPLVSAAVDDDVDDGRMSLDTGSLSSSAVYRLALIDGSGVIADSTVTVLEGGAPPSVSTDARRYERGEPIRVDWFGAPGNRYDWLTLIRECFDPESCPIRQWRYVNAKSIGTGRFTRDSEGIWPLRPGRYAVGLCLDDDFDCIATSEIFRIVRG
jgi:hypothetical protein